MLAAAASHRNTINTTRVLCKTYARGTRYTGTSVAHELMRVSKSHGALFRRPKPGSATAGRDSSTYTFRSTEVRVFIYSQFPTNTRKLTAVTSILLLRIPTDSHAI